jgi:Flp pilus assembly protein TadG
MQLPIARRRRSGRRFGAAVVELAIALPLLLFLVVAGVDFARVYYNAQIIADCARTGALYAANPDLADKTIYESVEQAALVGAQDLKPAPTVTVSYGTDELDQRYAEVKVTQRFSLLCSYPVVASNWDVTRTARARLFPAALE